METPTPQCDALPLARAYTDVDRDEIGRIFGVGELLQDLWVALDLGRAICDLVRQLLGPHHDLLEVTAVDGDRQVRIVGQEALDVVQRGVAESRSG